MPPAPLRSNDLSFVLLGGGAVALELHLPALRALNALPRTRVIEPNPDIAKLVQARFAGCTVERVGFDEFLARNERSAERTLAIVAVPNHLHPRAVEAALERGLHVLCEKPLALDAAACLHLDALAKRQGRTLSVAMVRRLLPSIVALRTALADDLIGEPQRVSVSHGGAYAWPVASRAPFEARNGGVLADMGIHYLDLIEHLVGAFEPVAYIDDARGGVEANCEFTLRGTTGLPIRLALSRTHALDNTLKIVGTKGALEMLVDSHDTCTWQTYGGRALRAELRVEHPFMTGEWRPTFASCFIEQIERTAAAILDGRAPDVSAADAARCVSHVQWAYAQRGNGRAHAPSTGGPARPTLAPAPIVVTGGTGFIGQHVVERLVDLGFDDIRVPVRSYRSCAGVARFGVELTRTDLLDVKQLTRLIHGTRHVIHLAYGRDDAEARRVTVEGTRRVVEAAIAAQCESVVVLSTMYVFGQPDTDELIDERWGYAPVGGAYGTTKAAMEKWCLKRAKSSARTRIAVLNPTCVFGPGGGAYTMLPMHMARVGSFGWIDEGRGQANYNYIDNLVDAIVLAASRPEAHGQRFLINDGTCSWREFLTPLLGPLADELRSYTRRELHERPGAPRASARDLLRHLSSDLELLDILNRMPVAGQLKRAVVSRTPRVRSALVGLQASDPTAAAPHEDSNDSPRYPPRWIADVYGPTGTRFSAAKAERLLGWRPAVSLPEAQARSARWLASIATAAD